MLPQSADINYKEMCFFGLGDARNSQLLAGISLFRHNHIIIIYMQDPKNQIAHCHFIIEHTHDNNRQMEGG